MERDLTQLTKLNIGCGDNQGKEYINLDIRPETKPDVIADARKLPFEDERFETVFASHVLEHFSYLETRAILQEWIRVLKPGRILKIIVPNILVAFEYIKKVSEYGSGIGILYGAQDYKENFHKTGFTPDYLKRLLMEAGLTINSVFTGGYDLIIEGVK